MATLSLERVDHCKVTRLAVLHHKWGMESLLREVLQRWWSEMAGPPPLVSSDDDEPRPLPHVLPESESDSDSDSHTAGDYLRSFVLLQHSFVQRGQQAARGMRKRQSKR